MDRLTITQRTEIIKTYHKNVDSATATNRALRVDYGLHNRPTKQAIGKIEKKFEETVVVTNMVRPVHHRFVSYAENITFVTESVAEDPNVSITRRSQELGMSYGIFWRILHLDLHLHPYKAQLTQQLKSADHLQRRRYVEWVLEKQTADRNFANKFFFSDESHFILSEYVNKQNCRIWRFENSQVIEKRPLHPEKVTDWRALRSEGVIGPYFENDDGTTVTVNSKRYGHMVIEFFCLLLRNTTWRRCGFNKMVPRIWLYCRRHFLVA